MQTHSLRITLALGVACLLGACGFQLRGSDDSAAVLPEEWKSMHLSTGNPNSEFSREVVARFAAQGVQWTDRRSANYILKLAPERFRQRNLSLTSEARVAEFELTMSVEFHVLANDNSEVMASTIASVVTQMENDPRNVTGKAEEIRLLKAEMRGDLARQIMRRIGFFAASAISAETT